LSLILRQILGMGTARGAASAARQVCFLLLLLVEAQSELSANTAY
jgi:hypothetical protein